MPDWSCAERVDWLSLKVLQMKVGPVISGKDSCLIPQPSLLCWFNVESTVKGASSQLWDKCNTHLKPLFFSPWFPLPFLKQILIIKFCFRSVYIMQYASLIFLPFMGFDIAICYWVNRISSIVVSRCQDLHDAYELSVPKDSSLSINLSGSYFSLASQHRLYYRGICCQWQATVAVLV